MYRIYQFFISLTLCSFYICSAQVSNEKIKVLIIDGFSNHDWKQTTIVVKRILNSANLFDISVSSIPSEIGSTAWHNWDPEFEKYDVIIQNTNNIQNPKLRWPTNIEAKLEQYLNNGGGLFILHSANNAFTHWTEYNKMIGLGWRKKEFGFALQIDEDGQIVRIPPGEGDSTYHGPRSDVVINILNSHPINNGMPKAWKTPDTELYKYARGPAKQLTVLSYAIDNETKIRWPVEWIVKYGNGRVYNSSMGHLWRGEIYPLGYRCVGFQTTLIRVVEWLSKRNVTFPIPENFPTKFNIQLMEK